jgi:hypothetical protein
MPIMTIRPTLMIGFTKKAAKDGCEVSGAAPLTRHEVKIITYKAVTRPACQLRHAHTSG